MARNGYCCYYRRAPPPIKRPKGAHSSLRPFEKEVLKSYPKQFRIFQNFLMHQGNPPADAKGIKTPSVDPIENYTSHRKILRKYKIDFFRSFSAYYELKSPRPTKLPRNLQYLIMVEGHYLFLKKLIKQNKGLKHIRVNSSKWRVCEMVARCLRFSKSLCSISFKGLFPFFSQMMCRRMLRNWANTMEKVEILGELQENYIQGPKNFTRVIEAIWQFPKLTEFRLLGEASGHVENFPLAKLQERNVAYDVRFTIEKDNYAPLMKSLSSECKPADCLVITDRDKKDKRNKIKMKKWKIERFSRRILRLNFFSDYFDELHPFLVLENIQSLQLDLCEEKCEYSGLSQLTRLKHLSIDIRGVQDTNHLKDFFSYLNKGVAPHRKLETLLIKGPFDSDINQESADALVRFFEACSKALRKVYFELAHNQNSGDLGYFHRSLSNLKHLQSLTLLIYSSSSEQLEELSEVVTGMKLLEELDLKIKDANFDGQKLNLTFPSQLKKLSFGTDTPFDVSKTLWPLRNLVSLELGFDDFSSGKFQKILEVPEKLKGLEIFALKEINIDYYDREEMFKNKPRLDRLMKECLNLKLIVVAFIMNRGMIILWRKNFSWSEINPIVDAIPFKKSIKFRHIQSY